MTDNELIDKWRKFKDYNAYKELKRRHTGMVMMIVNRYSSAPIPRSALEGETWTLFDDAVNSFSDKSGAQFGTHLNYHLRKLDRFTKKYQNVARIPENLSSRIGEFDRTKGDLTRQLRREPTNKEMAKAMKWSISNIKRLDKSRRQDLFEGGFEGVGGIETVNNAQNTNAIFSEVREELDQNEQILFDHLVGHGNTPQISSKKILAKKLGISVGRISQITTNIAKKMQPHLGSAYGVGIDIGGNNDDD